jgi:hypothetical protein
MQNQQMPNQVTTATVEGTRDKEKSCKKKMEGQDSRGFKCNENKKTGQRPMGMEEDCIGGQGIQQTVVL